MTALNWISNYRTKRKCAMLTKIVNIFVGVFNEKESAFQMPFFRSIIIIEWINSLSKSQIIILIHFKIQYFISSSLNVQDDSSVITRLIQFEISTGHFNFLFHFKTFKNQRYLVPISYLTLSDNFHVIQH